jgi:hypothetical protein
MPRFVSSTTVKIMRVAALLLYFPLFAPAAEPKQDTGRMAAFARLVGDEWQVTAASGKSMYHAWHWGPGKHSIRRMTDGMGAGGEPWREVQVYYWHPGEKQVRVLGLSPFDAGVSEGTIKFEKDAAEVISDLHQNRASRRMKTKWEFSGPGKYREALLEATGKGDYSPLVEFDHVRTKPPAKPREFAVGDKKPSDRLKAFIPLLGHTWEAKDEDIRAKTTFVWLPLADAIYARVEGKDGEHLLDAYVYHHTGSKVLRCLALSGNGGVYEGDVNAAEGVIEVDLKGHDGTQAVQNAVRFDFEKDGSVRQRVWSVKGKERTILMDVQHKAEKR